MLVTRLKCDKSAIMNLADCLCTNLSYQCLFWCEGTRQGWLILKLVLSWFQFNLSWQISLYIGMLYFAVRQSLGCEVSELMCGP